MTERCINLRPHEALAAAQGRLTVLVRPMGPQPPDGARFVPPGSELHIECELPRDEWAILVRCGMGDYDGPPYESAVHSMIACPLGAPGDVLLGREGWTRQSIILGTERAIYYRADHPPRAVLRWQSSACMPAWAVRHRFTVESVRVAQALALTDDEIRGNAITREHPPEWARAGSGGLWCWIARIGRAG